MAVQIPFNREHAVDYGVLETLTPTLRRITAPNPSPYTFYGTGTYVIGRGQVAVVDPGPAIDKHVTALLKELNGESISHILVTHTHMDHSPACALLQQHTDALTYGYGPHGAGKSLHGGKPDEGGDLDFIPDVAVVDGDIISGEGWQFECVHTPGHTANHLCFAHTTEKYLLSGDHVMGWSTSVISPPDGDMGDYMRSLQRLLERDETLYWPSHGGPVRDPRSFVKAFIQHREQREQQVLDCIANGSQVIEDMVPVIYTEIDHGLFPAAARSVLATVFHLVEKGLVLESADDQSRIIYRLA